MAVIFGPGAPFFMTHGLSGSREDHSCLQVPDRKLDAPGSQASLHQLGSPTFELCSAEDSGCDLHGALWKAAFNRGEATTWLRIATPYRPAYRFDLLHGVLPDPGSRLHGPVRNSAAWQVIGAWDIPPSGMPCFDQGCGAGLQSGYMSWLGLLVRLIWFAPLTVIR